MNYLQHEGNSGHSGVPLSGQTELSVMVLVPVKAKALTVINNIPRIKTSLCFISYHLIPFFWSMISRIGHSSVDNFSDKH